MDENRKIIFHKIFERKNRAKSAKNGAFWGVFGHFRGFFVSHETQPPRRIVPRETYIFAPFFTLSRVFHMKRRFYYIFAFFNEILVTCETSLLCGFVAFSALLGAFRVVFGPKWLAKQFVHLDFAINKCSACLLLHVYAYVVGGFVL